MTLANPQHEAFCQARFTGKTHEQACAAAGLSSVASAKEEIQERIAELYRERATGTAYDKASAVRDLLAIIHTAPSDASDDHPLCEVRMGKDGPYHRFPPKLQAMARLIKLMGWDDPPPKEPESPRRDTMTDWIVATRTARFRRQPTASEPESSNAAGDKRADVETEIARIKAQIYGTTGPSTEAAQSEHDSTPCAHPPSTGVAPEAAEYGKTDAIRDLITIVHARPTEASPDHPLCEARLTSWGHYHRFPSKLAAITLLSRLSGWTHRPRDSDSEPYDPDANLRSFLHSMRKRAERRLRSQ